MKYTQINPVSNQSIKEFESKKDEIIKKVVNRSCMNNEDLSCYGEDTQRIIKSGILFTTKMLKAAMVSGEVSLLEDQLNWAKDRLTHDGVTSEQILHRFIIYRDVVAEMLSNNHAQQINQFLNWMIKKQEELINQRDSDEK